MGIKSNGMVASIIDDKQMIVNPIYGTDEANETVSVYLRDNGPLLFLFEAVSILTAYFIMKCNEVLRLHASELWIMDNTCIVQ